MGAWWPWWLTAALLLVLPSVMASATGTKPSFPDMETLLAEMRSIRASVSPAGQLRLRGGSCSNVQSIVSRAPVVVTAPFDTLGLHGTSRLTI